MTRAKFTAEDNYVTLTAENEVGEVETTRYFVSRGERGGYVKIHDKAGRFPRVCDKLYTTGPTLWATADTLADVIRREYRRGKDANKRREQRWMDGRY